MCVPRRSDPEREMLWMGRKGVSRAAPCHLRRPLRDGVVGAAVLLRATHLHELVFPLWVVSFRFWNLWVGLGCFFVIALFFLVARPVGEEDVCLNLLGRGQFTLFLFRVCGLGVGDSRACMVFDIGRGGKQTTIHCLLLTGDDGCWYGNM
jgi:hypothetical protein